MSAAKHTSGPLTVSVEDKWPFHIVTKNAAGEVVFSRGMPCNSTQHKNSAEAISGKGMDPEWNAEWHNKCAIADEVVRAAAPDLLAALQTLRDSDGFMHMLDRDQEVIEAAIAKANGGTA